MSNSGFCPDTGIHSRCTKKLLIVGPLPPPVGGASVTVQTVVEALSTNPSVRLAIIDTAPDRSVAEKPSMFRTEKVRRSMTLVPRYLREVRTADAVLVFSNNFFTLTMVPVLLLLAHTFGKPFHIKPVGGDLDIYLDSRWKPVRRYMLRVLRAADSVLVQTRLLQASLGASGCSNARYVPGFRSQSELTRANVQSPNGLRLIFLGHIFSEKGPMLLLEALRTLSRRHGRKVSCDFYGPVHEDFRPQFLAGLAATPNARYCGVAPAGSGANLAAGYDALVLPTFFECEGHPGAIIEAMQAGIPVIATRHRAIPELIEDGQNGLLVPCGDSGALADAIEQLSANPLLMEQMGHMNYCRGQEFRTDVVVSRVLAIVLGS